MYRVSQDTDDISALLGVIVTKPYLTELREYIDELSGDPGLVAEDVHGVQLVVMEGWIVPANYLVL